MDHHEKVRSAKSLSEGPLGLYTLGPRKDEEWHADAHPDLPIAKRIWALWEDDHAREMPAQPTSPVSAGGNTIQEKKSDLGCQVWNTIACLRIADQSLGDLRLRLSS
jgi:hypothetical protein